MKIYEIFPANPKSASQLPFNNEEHGEKISAVKNRDYLLEAFVKSRIIINLF
jgi:hypothetical protein